MLIKAYDSLLADIRRLTGRPLGSPVDLTMSWVLIEAPKLDKELLQYLEGNRDSIPTFPEWLMPLWDAFISNNRDAGILQMLRTVLVFGYKAEFEPDEKQLQEGQKAFEEANQGCCLWGSSFTNEELYPQVFDEARRLVSSVISRCNWTEAIPCHGPGAVFPRRSASTKGDFAVYTPLTRFYPYDVHFNAIHESGWSDLTSTAVEHDLISCKMVAVPKDSRGPRLICVHPSEAVWIQQGQRHVLENAIEHHRLTSGRINFRDQTVNGRLALQASRDRGFVTIDLKEASDRISSVLVQYLFGYAYQFLNSSRASTCRLLDGSVVGLSMYAPMGNATTFPVESLCFWSLVRAGILCRHGQYCDDVYVFGDDIVVPTKYYEGAIYGLVSAGMIPNFGKTFRKGLFRESCGVDAFNGIDVTPLRCKVRHVVSYSDAESLCDLAKRSRIRGFSDLSAFLYSVVAKRFGRLSLTNNPNASGLIEYTDYDFGKLLLMEPRVRFNTRLHVWQVPYRRRVRTLEVRTADAWWHLQDSLPWNVVPEELKCVRSSMTELPMHSRVNVD